MRLASFKKRALEIGAPEVGHLEPGVLQPGIGEVGPPEIGSFQASSPQSGVPEIGTRQGAALTGVFRKQAGQRVRSVRRRRRPRFHHRRDHAGGQNQDHRRPDGRHARPRGPLPGAARPPSGGSSGIPRRSALSAAIRQSARTSEKTRTARSISSAVMGWWVTARSCFGAVGRSLTPRSARRADRVSAVRSGWVMSM